MRNPISANRNTDVTSALVTRAIPMKSLSMLIVGLSLLIITGCGQVKQPPRWEDVTVHGSGNLVSQARPITGFDRIEAGLYFNLTVQQGDEFEVVFIADDNWVDYLSAELDGTTLRLGLKDGYAYNFYNTTMQVEITMPKLSGLTLSEFSQAHIKGFAVDEPSAVELTGSSYMDRLDG